MKNFNQKILPKLLRICIVIILCCNITATQAQPEKEFYGCKSKHHLHHKKAAPLSLAETIVLQNSNERSDTLDILHYAINLDFSDFSQASISGNCEISVQSKMENVTSITLDLLAFEIDSITAQGQNLEYAYDGNFLTVEFPTPLGIESEYDFAVHYHGQPEPAASGFGGLVFQGGIAYNLGIGLGATPYNYGRGWFPCFDTFVERATFEFNITSFSSQRAYCVGTFMGQDSLGGGKVLRSYELTQEIPTYLAGIAVGDYQAWQSTHTGAFGDVELEVLALPSDLSTVVNSFQYLDESVDALEKWWGKYPWERVGFVMTGNGAMEHPTNVAYPLFLASNGPTPSHNEVMAHELGHHWWGDIVTLSGPENMWIKEGPAEYSSHLFYEHVFGREEFVEIVKNNLLLVLKEAHLDDDGYQALSPMPYEQTYGTHTYQKGALVLHNLRGYLGDDLYISGMRSVLDTFAYQSINAEQFRDQLTLATGVDMVPYFDAWIFAPGYAAYEVEAMTSTPQGNDFEVELTVQQKLHAASVFHQQVPVGVTFVDENFNVYHDQIIQNGEFTTSSFTVPFAPAAVYLNGEHDLNLAVIGSHKTVSQTGATGLSYGGIVVKVDEMVDSAFLRVDQFYVAPDPSPTNIYDARLSENRYFRVAGIVKDGFEASGQLTYSGGSPNDFDYDLLSQTEDSLVLLYRTDASMDWAEHPDYEVKTLGSSTDGTGIIVIKTLELGEYTMANAVIIPTANTTIAAPKNDWMVFPNPASEKVIIGGNLPENGNVQITVFDILGKNVLEKNVEVVDEKFTLNLNVADLARGIYAVKITDEKGKEWGSQSLEIMR